MFIAVGVVGVVLLLLSILVDDLLDAVLPDAGWFSGPVVGAFLAAFGLFGWAVDTNADVSTWLAVLAGIGGGILLGWFTYRLVKALWSMPTDSTPTTQDTVGAQGRVVTPIAAGGTGEVVVRLGGQPVKYTATAGVDVATGTPIVVVAVESSTKLRVEPEASFWGGSQHGP